MSILVFGTALMIQTGSTVHSPSNEGLFSDDKSGDFYFIWLDIDIVIHLQDLWDLCCFLGLLDASFLSGRMLALLLLLLLPILLSYHLTHHPIRVIHSDTLSKMSQSRRSNHQMALRPTPTASQKKVELKDIASDDSENDEDWDPKKKNDVCELEEEEDVNEDEEDDEEDEEDEEDDEEDDDESSNKDLKDNSTNKIQSKKKKGPPQKKSRC